MQDLQKKGDPSFQFSQDFEMGVLQEGVVDLINKRFVAKKIAIPADADRKLAKNQARIEIWSPTRQKIGLITPENDNLLSRAAFTEFLKVRVAKSEKLVRDEVARLLKEKAELDAARKESASR